MAEVHDRGCGTIFGGGKLAGVAVGEESHAGLYEGERVLTYFFADVDVLLFDVERFIAKEPADLLDGFPRVGLDDALHTVQCP